MPPVMPAREPVPPVRSRILFAPATVGELCVGDLALTLDVIQDQVLYGLKMPRRAGLAWFRKAGPVVFCQLGHGIPHPRLEHCLPKLTIASPEAGRGHP
jgi:ArsR family transcriptional regulator, lead/cadmium/zinc/bismuth-responsive transcriptional repressor